MNFDKANSKNWRKYKGKRITFFKTEIGGRKIRVRVHLKPREEGNIIWYLATRRSPIEEDKEKRWTTPWLRLKDWKQLGFLCLALSKFCVRTRYMSRKNFEKIQTFKKRWEHLVDRDFKDLKSGKSLMREVEEKLL